MIKRPPAITARKTAGTDNNAADALAAGAVGPLAAGDGRARIHAGAALADPADRAGAGAARLRVGGGGARAPGRGLRPGKPEQ
mgnify:CR=1 FL=1